MDQTNLARKFFTPPEVARVLGVDSAKVRAWIASGELPAVNLATSLGGGKPRFRVSVEALESFQRRRAVVPPARQTRRRKTDCDLSRFGIGPATS